MPDALVERDGPLMIVTMIRPHRMNAQSGAMLVRMYDAWVEASNDEDIRCIIVTGADGNFSSGADLKAMVGDSGPHADTEIDSVARLAADRRLMHKAYLKDYRPTKPVIAAVEGVAIAGGTELLLGTDIRVAAKSARFGVSEARWALYPMMGSSVRLPRSASRTSSADERGQRDGHSASVSTKSWRTPAISFSRRSSVQSSVLIGGNTRMSTVARRIIAASRVPTSSA